MQPSSFGLALSGSICNFLACFWISSFMSLIIKAPHNVKLESDGSDFVKCVLQDFVFIGVQKCFCCTCPPRIHYSFN